MYSLNAIILNFKIEIVELIYISTKVVDYQYEIHNV